MRLVVGEVLAEADAAARANLGQHDDAEADYKLAMARIDRMTEREKFRTRGGYYLLVRNPQSAIDEFNALVKQFPADTGGLNNLALAYRAKDLLAFGGDEMPTPGHRPWSGRCRRAPTPPWRNPATRKR